MHETCNKQHKTLKEGISQNSTSKLQALIQSLLLRYSQRWSWGYSQQQMDMAWLNFDRMELCSIFIGKRNAAPLKEIWNWKEGSILYSNIFKHNWSSFRRMPPYFTRVPFFHKKRCSACIVLKEDCNYGGRNSIFQRSLPCHRTPLDRTCLMFNLFMFITNMEDPDHHLTDTLW